MNEARKKPVEALRVGDLEKTPVWRFVNSDEEEDTTVIPVRSLPVTTLANRLVATKVRFANGTEHWAVLGNVDLSNAKLTKHFLTLNVLDGERWVMLARYHDPDYPEKGPQGFARALGLEEGEVFPIEYDIASFAKGTQQVLVGRIEAEPEEILSRSELISLAVP